MDEQKMEYHFKRLKRGEIYWDNKYKEKVEFGYLGQTGMAIVYEPGDSGGGMQSSWGTDAENLEIIVEEDTNIDAKKYS